MHAHLIEQLDVFRGLEGAARTRLVAGFVLRTVASSEVVFREGDEPDAFYVVAEGRLVAFRDAVGKPIRCTAGGFQCHIGPAIYEADTGRDHFDRRNRR